MRTWQEQLAQVRSTLFGVSTAKRERKARIVMKAVSCAVAFNSTANQHFNCITVRLGGTA